MLSQWRDKSGSTIHHVELSNSINQISAFDNNNDDDDNNSNDDDNNYNSDNNNGNNDNNDDDDNDDNDDNNDDDDDFTIHLKECSILSNDNDDSVSEPDSYSMYIETIESLKLLVLRHLNGPSIIEEHDVIISLFKDNDDISIDNTKMDVEIAYFTHQKLNYETKLFDHYLKSLPITYSKYVSSLKKYSNVQLFLWKILHRKVLLFLRM